MGAWPGWEGAHKPQAREGPGPLCPVPLPHPHAQGIWGSPSELFAGAGVAGGGPEALAGVPCSSRGSSARPRLVTLECGQGRAGEPVPGHASQLPVSGLQTCVIWGPSRAVPSAPAASACASASRGCPGPAWRWA